jgi:hypothetical protein
MAAGVIGARRDSHPSCLRSPPSPANGRGIFRVYIQYSKTLYRVREREEPDAKRWEGEGAATDFPAEAASVPLDNRRWLWKRLSHIESLLPMAVGPADPVRRRRGVAARRGVKIRYYVAPATSGDLRKPIVNPRPARKGW